MKNNNKTLYLGLSEKKGTTHCPLIEIIPRPFEREDIQDALKLFPHYTHILLTSKSAIPLLYNHLKKMNFLEMWKSKETIVVGKATAACLREYQIEPTAIASNETAEGLTEALQSLSLNKQSWSFWPHSSRARNVIPDFYENQKWRLASCPFYDTKTRRPDPLPDLDHYNEIVFTSPSTIEAFIEVFGKIPKDKKLTCIGPVTANGLSFVHPAISFFS